MKKLFILSATLFLIAVLSFSVCAANNVSHIDAEIIINDDGSADFHQVWQCNFSEDTEVYYFFPDEERFTVSGFLVSDGDKLYTPVDNWDISASFEEKAGKSGLLETDDGYELCWGITEYGEKTYDIYFRVDNLITSFKDADGTYFALFSKNIATTPTDITVSISLANGKTLIDGVVFDEGSFLNGGNCEFMDSGYNGYAEITDGALVTKTDTPLQYSDHMSFQLVFEKGLIRPTTAENKKVQAYTDGYIDKYTIFGNYFDSDSSDFYESDEFIAFMALAIAIGVPAFLVLLGYIIYKIIIKVKIGNPEPYRNEPEMGIEASYIMLKAFGLCKEQKLFTVILLDMIEKGIITPVMPDADDPLPVKNGNVKFRINDVDTTDFSKAHASFYKFLKFAAKSDMLLEPVEMMLKAQDNVYMLREIMKDYVSEAQQRIESRGCKRTVNHEGPLSYSPTGVEEMRKVVGYKKHIESYSANTPVNYYGYDLWKTPIKYAVLFGIEDKVTEELRKTYPTSDYEIREYSKDILFAEKSGKIIYDAMIASEKQGNRYGHSSYSNTSYYSPRYRSGGFGGGRGGFGGGGGRSGGGTR